MTEMDVTLRGAAAIRQVFQRRKESGGKVLIPYIMAADPDLGTTEKIVRALSGIDVDVIELGMPFSDPLADGPVIQLASERALKQGLKLSLLLESIHRMREYVDTPIIIMTYYNLFLQYGLEKFAADAAQAGVDGLIVVDMPPEESADLHQALEKEKLALIYLAAPTSTDKRIKTIADLTTTFIYYVSRTGVTGVQANIADDLVSNLERIKKITDKPVAVGFGISNPEQACNIAQHADGVAIGSAIVRLIAETRELHDRVCAKFLKPYVDALHQQT